MRIRKTRNKLRQTAYTAELSEYDAEPPARTWLLDEQPDKINPELEAVALYLIFGNWCGGEFHVPQKMGPNTAAAINRHAGMDFFPNPIEFYPKPIYRGGRTVRVTDSWSNPSEPSLVLLSGANWNGSIKSTSSLVLSTNSDLFKSGRGLNHLLAPAVLLAEELNLAELLVDPAERLADLESYSDLLRQVGVAVNLEV